MIAGMTIVLIIFIICAPVLFGIYMYLCSENGVKMFADQRYEEHMRKLEECMEELKKE